MVLELGTVKAMRCHAERRLDCDLAIKEVWRNALLFEFSECTAPPSIRFIAVSAAIFAENHIGSDRMDRTPNGDCARLQLTCAQTLYTYVYQYYSEYGYEYLELAKLYSFETKFRNICQIYYRNLAPRTRSSELVVCLCSKS